MTSYPDLFLPTTIDKPLPPPFLMGAWTGRLVPNGRYDQNDVAARNTATFFLKTTSLVFLISLLHFIPSVFPSLAGECERNCGSQSNQTRQCSLHIVSTATPCHTSILILHRGTDPLSPLEHLLSFTNRNCRKKERKEGKKEGTVCPSNPSQACKEAGNAAVHTTTRRSNGNLP